MCVGVTLKEGGFLSYMHSCFDLRTNIPVHGVTMEILIEKKGGGWGGAFLGQSIGYPFKPEHSAGRFSKCQSHFWMWTDSLMDHSDESVGGPQRGRRWKTKAERKKSSLMYLFVTPEASTAEACTFRC